MDTVRRSFAVVITFPQLKCASNERGSIQISAPLLGSDSRNISVAKILKFRDVRYDLGASGLGKCDS